eukprot:COSAG03_NODE_9115_length_745_cov_0.873065_3_plen_50_part_01
MERCAVGVSKLGALMPLARNYWAVISAGLWGCDRQLPNMVVELADVVAAR